MEESLISNRERLRHTDLGRRIDVLKMVRSNLLPVGRGRQIGLGGFPPVGVPGTPLSHDISGSSSSNDSFSTLLPMIFSVDYDGINAIPVR